VNSKLCHLRSKLRHTRLESYVFEFLLKIQTLIGSIHAIGESISYREHLNVILEGLPQEYESTISLISGKFGVVTIEEVETLLLGHEARLERFRKNFAPSINLTVPSNSSSHDEEKEVSSQADSQSFSKPSFGSDERGGRGSFRGGCGGRGRGGRGNAIQYQVCHKHGHDVSICYHRFKKDYTPSISDEHNQAQGHMGASSQSSSGGANFTSFAPW